MFDCFKLAFLLIPITSRNVKIYVDEHREEWVGYKDYFVFGIRIARFQGTIPWNNS